MSVNFAQMRTNNFRVTKRSKLLKWTLDSPLFGAEYAEDDAGGVEIIERDSKDEYIALFSDGGTDATDVLYISGISEPGFIDRAIADPLIKNYQNWLSEDQIVLFNQSSYGHGIKSTPNNDIFRVVLYKGRLYADWSITYDEFLLDFAELGGKYTSYYQVPTKMDLSHLKGRNDDVMCDFAGDCAWVNNKDAINNFVKFGFKKEIDRFAYDLEPGMLSDCHFSLSNKLEIRAYSDSYEELAEFAKELSHLIWACVEKGKGPITFSLMFGIDVRNRQCQIKTAFDAFLPLPYFL